MKKRSKIKPSGHPEQHSVETDDVFSRNVARLSERARYQFKSRTEEMKLESEPEVDLSFLKIPSQVDSPELTRKGLLKIINHLLHVLGTREAEYSRIFSERTGVFITVVEDFFNGKTISADSLYKIKRWVKTTAVKLARSEPE